MKKRLKLFLLNIIATTDYDKMGKTTRILKLFFDIFSALLYTAYAIYVLATKNTSQWTMYVIIAVALLFISLIIILIARSKSKLKYSKKNYKLTTKTLKNSIKFVSLIPPAFILFQSDIIGSGFETALNIYAIIHISFVVYKLFLSVFKLFLHKFRKEKYIKKEEKRIKRKNFSKKIYSAVQNIAKNSLDKENYTIKNEGNLWC